MVITNTETVNPMEMLRFDLLNISPGFFSLFFIREFGSQTLFMRPTLLCLSVTLPLTVWPSEKNGWDSVFVVTVPAFAQHFPAASISKYGSFNWNKPQWNRCTSIFFRTSFRQSKDFSSNFCNWEIIFEHQLNCRWNVTWDEFHNYNRFSERARIAIKTNNFSIAYSLQHVCLYSHSDSI